MKKRIFTGHYDSNNKKIYEGDIIEFNEKYNLLDTPYRLKVTFKNNDINFATFDLGKDAWTIVKK